MNTRNSDSRSDDWTRPLTEAFERVEVPARPDDAEMLRLIDAAGSARDRYNPWRIATAPRLVAAAAIILVALMLTGIWWPDGLSPQKAFAQMVDNVQKARNGVMDMLVARPGKQPIPSRLFLMSPGHMRQEYTDDGGVPMISVYDFTAHRMLSLFPKDKRASVVDLPHASASQPALRQFDIVAAFRDLSADRAKLVGESKEAGRAILNYEVHDPTGDVRRVWVDKETLLPVRVEFPSSLPGHAEPTTLTLDRMRWNVPLDDALFATSAPEGYTLIPTALGAAGPEDLARLLRLWTTLSGGAFPDEFTPLGMYRLTNLFGDYQKRVESKELDRNQAWAAVARAVGVDLSKVDEPAFRQQVTATAGRGASYLAILMHNPEWHWLGKGAKLHDADRIVCYWRADDGTHYTAIDAELSVRTLDAPPKQ